MATEVHPTVVRDAASTPHRGLPTMVLALIVPVVAVVAAIVTLNVTSEPGGNAAGVGRGGAAGAGNAIVIKNFTFSPTPLRVKAGTTITVTNQDGTAHSVTADNKSFDTHDLGSGKQGTITVGTPGRYTYHCDIHNYMTGVIEAT